MKIFTIIFLLITIFIHQNVLAQDDHGFIPITDDNINQIIPLSAIISSKEDVYLTIPEFNSAGNLVKLGSYVTDLATFKTYEFRNSNIYFGPADDELNIHWNERGRGSYHIPTQSQSYPTSPYTLYDFRAVSPSQRYVITMDGLLIDIERDTKNFIQEITHTAEGNTAVRDVVFSHDERYMAFTLNFYSTVIVDLDTLSLIETLPYTGKKFFVKDTDNLVICERPKIILVDRQTGDTLQVINDANTCFHSLDGQILAPIWNKQDHPTPDQQIIYSTMGKTFDELDTFTLPDVETFTFSPDNALIAIKTTYNYIPTLHIYETSSQSILRSMIFEGRPVQFSRDSQLIIINHWGANGGHIWHYDKATSTLKPILEKFGDIIYLSPDHSTLVIKSHSTWLFYGIETAVRQRQPLMFYGNVLPSYINVRSEPKFEAEVIGLRERGRGVITGFENGYLYMPESEGWIRADLPYIRLPNPLTNDDLRSGIVDNKMLLTNIEQDINQIINQILKPADADPESGS